MRWIVPALLLLAGCSSGMEPAQRLISDIDRTVRAAAPEAALYAPQRLSEVQGRLDSLKAAFEKDDYAAVIANAPPVLAAAQALGGAAAAHKNALLKVLNEQWSALAGTLPDEAAALQNRIDVLSRNATRKTAAGVDLDGARAGLSRDWSLWSKAQAAFAIGNMEEAVSTAKTLQSQLQGLAGSLEPATAEIRRPASLR